MGFQPSARAPVTRKNEMRQKMIRGFIAEVLFVARSSGKRRRGQGCRPTGRGKSLAMSRLTSRKSWLEKESKKNKFQIFSCSVCRIILFIGRSGGNSRPSCPSDVGGGTFFVLPGEGHRQPTP